MKTAIFAASLLLCGCASTFHLGKVQPQTGRNRDQQQLDTLTCKDQAKMAVESGGQYAKEWLLGFTLVGYPVAIASDHAKSARSVFVGVHAGQGVRRHARGMTSRPHLFAAVLETLRGEILDEVVV